MFKQVLKRVLIGVVVTVLLFCVVTSSYSRKTSASIFPALALGTGALSALVASYFATAGIEFSGNDVDANFLGNYVANWVKGSSAWSGNPYFNDSGEYIGDPDQLSIVQNNETSVTSIIFGKEFAIWMEALKELFVSENNLSVSVPTRLTNTSNIVLGNASFPVYNCNFASSYSTPTVYNLFPVGSLINETTEYRVSLGGVYTIVFYQGQASMGRVSISYNIFDRDNNAIYPQNVHVRTMYSNVYENFDALIRFALVINAPWPNNSANTVSLGIFDYDSVNSVWNLSSSNAINKSMDLSQVSDISLDGSLTDGYDDFADAISTPLESDDEDLVIATGVGVIPDILNPADIVDAILDKIAIGELNPTYEGSYENKETAEEELEGEREFVPVLPEGWVKVEGLQSFFPFCIPWDIYSVIALLNVPPEAPNFTWRMDFGGRFDSYDVEIDLSDFEIVARVFRIMIVIGFLLFLILKTRDLIRG